MRYALVFSACILSAMPVQLTAASSSADTNAATAAAHQRLLPLQGGRNFRDLGGYRTGDGLHVRWGVLFRSGSMGGLTTSDYTYLEARGIRVVCDFRDNRERAAEPSRWPAGRAPTILSDDYVMDAGIIMPPGASATWTEDQVRNAFTASYPRMLSMFNHQYRRMFAELLAGNVPLAFNCSAGKDRTGIAAALILTALGVPRAAVIDDYTATNRYLDTGKLLSQGKAPANMAVKPGDGSTSPAAMMTSMQPGALRAILAADPRYIEAALAVLDHHPDGAAGYLHDELGLARTDVAKLRRMYLER